jgi:branched-chain amino acid transport system permease protein
MKNLLNSKIAKTNAATYGIVVIGFVVMQILASMGMLGSAMKGYLVPICAYIVLAVSLNLLVGICGELSLGHAGFMGIGAFTGIVIASLAAQSIASPVLRLLAAMFCGGIMAGIMGFLIGIPVMRLRGDYLAIVTLAFGEIIRNVLNTLYFSVEGKALHVALHREEA